MLRQSLPAEAERTSKRLKTVHDGTHNPKLSFRSLVDMLEPDGPSAASSWKSIVDREEQVIVFFQVEYLQFIPQLSKCIRVRRERSKTFEEILIPSVFFGRYLDDAFVEKAFGTPHLSHFSDLQTLLSIVNQSGKPSSSAFENNSDGEQDKEDDRILNGGYEAAFSPLNDDFIPEIPLYPNLVITQINPPSDNSSRNSNEKWESSQKPQNIPPKLQTAEKKCERNAQKNEKDLAKEFGIPAALSTDSEAEDCEENNVEEPPSDPKEIKVFNSVLTGDKKPYPAPLLDCQMPGPGKVSLTKAGRDGKFLYIEKRELNNLRRDHGKKQQRYLSTLFDVLVGPKGLAFIKHRYEDRKRARAVTPGNKFTWQISSKKLLGQDFLYLLEEHLTEVGMGISTSELLRMMRHKFDHYANGMDKNFTQNVLRQVGREDADKTSASTEEGVSPSKVFKIPSPPLACEQSGVWKTPLVPKDDKEFPGMFFYMDKIELNLLLKNARQPQYPKKILTALLGEEGSRFLQEWRAAYFPSGFLGKARCIPKAEDIFSKAFVETLRVHLVRKHSRNCKTLAGRIPELDYTDLYRLMDKFIARLPQLPDVNQPDTLKLNSEAEVCASDLPSSVSSKATKSVKTQPQVVKVSGSLMELEDYSEGEGGQDFEDYFYGDADGPCSLEPTFPENFDMTQFLVPEPTSALPESEELLPDYPFPSGLVITEILPPAEIRTDRTDDQHDGRSPSNDASTGSVRSESEDSLSEAEDSLSDCESESKVESTVKGKKQKSVKKKKVGSAKSANRTDSQVKPPEDLSKVTVFRSLVFGEKVPCPPPELDCQTAGPGKVPLTTTGSHDTHVYIKALELTYLTEKWREHPGRYLSQLVHQLMGPIGWNFVFGRPEQRATTDRHNKNATLPGLLTAEFTHILKRHMDENGMPTSVKNLQNTLRGRHDYMATHRTAKATPGHLVAANDRLDLAKAGKDAHQEEEAVASGKKGKNSERGFVTPEDPPDDPLIIKVFYSVLPGDRALYPPPQLDCQVAGSGKVPLTAVGSGNRHLYISRKEQKYRFEYKRMTPGRYLSRLVDQLLGSKGWNFVFACREERAKDNPTAGSHLLHGHMEENGMPMSVQDLQKVFIGKHDHMADVRRSAAAESRSSHMETVRDADNEEKVVAFGRKESDSSKKLVTPEEPPNDPLVIKVFYSVVPGDREVHPPPLLDCQVAGPGKVPLLSVGIENRHLYVNRKEQKSLLKKFGQNPRRYVVQLLQLLIDPEGWDFVFARREQSLQTISRHRPVSVFQLLTNDFLFTVEEHMKENNMPLSVEVIKQVITGRRDYLVWTRRTHKTQKHLRRSSGKQSKTDMTSDDEDEVPDTDASDEEIPATVDASSEKVQVSGKVFAIESPALVCEVPGKGKVPLVKMDDEDFPGMVFFLDGSKLESLEEDCKRRPPKTYSKKVFTALLGVEGLAFLKEWRIENQELFGGKSACGDKWAEILFTGAFLETLRVYLLRNKMSLGQAELQETINDFVSSVSNIDMALFEAKSFSGQTKFGDAHLSTPEESFRTGENMPHDVDVFQHEIAADDNLVMQVNYGSALKEADTIADNDLPPIVYTSIVRRTLPSRSSEIVSLEVRNERPKRQSRSTKEPVYKEPDSSSEEESEEGQEPSDDESVGEETDEDMDAIPQTSFKPEVTKIMPKKSSAGSIQDSVLGCRPPITAILVAPFSVFKIFNTDVCGGEQPVLPPLLHCQRPSDGKIPLTAESVEGKNLYIDRKELRTHRAECGNNASACLHRLVSSLFGFDGWNFLVDSEARRTARLVYFGQPTLDLLSREFLNLLQRHMNETGLPMFALDIRTAILNHCKSLIPLGSSA